MSDLPKCDVCGDAIPPGTGWHEHAADPSLPSIDLCAPCWREWKNASLPLHD